MAMSHFAMNVFGLEPQDLQRPGEHGNGGMVSSESPPDVSTWRARRGKRTSYANNSQTTCVPCKDEPPSYDKATKRQIAVSARRKEGTEILPEYECTVAAEGRMLLNVESINPLHMPFEGDWREVYVVLRGTMLNLHRVKDGCAGKLLRTYTLQHAEVGLATDSQHTVLIPQTKLARLIPTAARRRAWQRDADLFASEKQTILRLRIETDQLLLADSSERTIHSLILALCAAIDISPALDERALPKQCTMPRRRRRPRPDMNVNLNDPALLRQQAQILEERYPGLAESSSGRTSEDARPDLQRTNSSDPVSDRPQTPWAREEDDPDLSMIREESNLGASQDLSPEYSSNTVSSTISASTSQTPAMHFDLDMIHATAATNFDPTGKWQPSTPQRSPSNHQRYVRRCMPVLLAESPRASEVLVARGGSARIRIDWATETLEPWELEPPSYRAHQFPAEQTDSLLPPRADSPSTTTTTNTATAAVGDEDAADRISPVDSDSGELAAEGLMKMASASSMLAAKAASTAAATAAARNGAARRRVRQPGVRTAADMRLMAQDYQGVVFCF